MIKIFKFIFVELHDFTCLVKKLSMGEASAAVRYGRQRTNHKKVGRQKWLQRILIMYFKFIF